MYKAYAGRVCCYETRASRCGFGACVLLPLCLLTALAAGLINTNAKLELAEHSVTVLKIMPAPPEIIPMPLPVEEYHPTPIEPIAPLEAPKPKPTPVGQPKPKPSPTPVDKPVAAPPVETSPPVQAHAAPNVGQTPVKAAGPPQTAETFSQGDYDKFFSAFLAKVRQELVYPKAAQRANISGTVRVTVVFNAQGQVVSYQTQGGNYHKMLGEAAEKTISQVKATWQPPLAPGKTQTIVIPVVFELK